MKKYILNIDDFGLCLMKFNEEKNHYEKVGNVQKEKLIDILDVMIESKNMIEKMNLTDNILHIRAIYPTKNSLFIREEMEIFISNKILSNEEFRLAIIAELNKYNCVRQETNENIGDLLFRPENINKRRLMLNS